MKDLQALLDKIQEERFVHHISELTYDRLFALWHLSPVAERHLSEILSRVITGLFFVRYLKHVHDAVIDEAAIEDKLSSKDLADQEKIEKTVKSLGHCEKFRALLEEEILPQLVDIMENTKARDLTDLVKLAHAGDFLLSALKDMKDSEDPEYPLWLEAVPEYYEKDLIHLSLKKRPVTFHHGKRRSLPLEKWVKNLNQYMPSVPVVSAKGRTFFIRPPVKERRRSLYGFKRWA